MKKARLTIFHNLLVSTLLRFDGEGLCLLMPFSFEGE